MIPLFKFEIKGDSMVPTFKENDVVLVNRLSYFLSKPKIGDLIVLKRGLPRHGKAGQYIIKRIAKIKNDRFFVIGDNKKESTDSRRFGWIDRKDIVGKILIKI